MTFVLLIVLSSFLEFERGHLADVKCNLYSILPGEFVLRGDGKIYPKEKKQTQKREQTKHTYTHTHTSKQPHTSNYLLQT